MTVVKQSSISTRIEENFSPSSLSSGSVSGSLFSASSVMGCPRKAIMDIGVEDGSDPGIDGIAFRYFIHRSDDFTVLNEDVSVSSMELNTEGVIDMVAKYADEHVIINIREGKSGDLPLSGDVVDMVSSMYSVGIWSGLICYVSDCGCRVFFVNPDRLDAKKMLKNIAERGRSLMHHRMSGNVPSGVVGSECGRCSHSSSCDELRRQNGASKLDEGKQEKLRGGQEEGERAGNRISAD